MTPIEECPELLQNLNRAVDQLAKLLAQPEPELWSWQGCVGKALAAVAAFYGGPASGTHVQTVIPIERQALSLIMERLDLLTKRSRVAETGHFSEWTRVQEDLLGRTLAKGRRRGEGDSEAQAK